MLNDEQKNKINEIVKTDVQNEQRVLGYMLSDEDVAILGCQMLEPIYFVVPHSAYIFKKIQSFVERGDKISNVQIMIDSILDEDWKNIDKDSIVNKDGFISNCMLLGSAFVGNNLAAEGMFTRIKEQYLRREFITNHEKGYYDMLNTANDNLETTATESMNKFEEILDNLTNKHEVEDYKSLALRVLKQKSTNKINTGFKDLDDIIGGMRTSQLVTVGAGTSVGKSAFAINLALNFCDQGEKVALWSFEMDEEEVMHRVFAARTRISSDGLKNSNTSEDHQNKLMKYIEETKDDIKLFTHRITNLNSFSLECRKLKKKHGVRVVIIDYLQLIHLNQNYENNRVRELEMITNKLKAIAAEYGILIIALSQLSRASGSRADKTPVLSDLRDSGSIEQDSNMVIFLYKSEDKVQLANVSERMIHVLVAKNRNGKIGTCCLRFNGSITKFTDNN